MASYQNAPTGLQAVQNITAAPWNGQLPGIFRIQSGYPYNIFKGDPVGISQTPNGGGYIVSMADPAASAGSGIPVSGVFNGCSYQTTVAQNPIDPASPGRIYWPGGQVTLANQDAIAQVIIDYNVIYSIQTGSTGANFSNVSLAFKVDWNNGNPIGSAPGLTGNPITGISNAFLTATAYVAGPGVVGAQILCIDPQSEPQQGTATFAGTGNTLASAVQYNRVWVKLVNSLFTQY